MKKQRMEIISSDNAVWDTAQINRLLTEGWRLAKNNGGDTIQHSSSFFTTPEYRIVVLEK